MSLISSRISLVTSSTQELESVQEQLLAVSNEARVSLSSTSDLYAQMARSTQALGLSSSYLLNVTDTISKTLTISGASATSASAALFQLSQGFSAGALRGEELNSVLEQTPRLAQAIADGMGVSIGELRALGAEGALTAEKVLSSLQSQASAVNAEFDGIAITAQGGWQTLENSIASTIGLLNEQYEITEGIGTVFIALGTAFKDTFKTLDIGLNESTGKAADFGLMVLDAVIASIDGIGSLYDGLETVGDLFQVVWHLGESAFYGIQVVTSTATLSIYEGFQSMGNGIISLFEDITNGIKSMFEDSINFIIDSYNSVASLVGLSSISTVRFEKSTFDRIDLSSDISRLLESRVIPTREAFEQSQADLSVAMKDLFTSGGGKELADNLTDSLAYAYNKLLLNKGSGSGGGGADVVNKLDNDNTFNINDEIKKQEEYTKKMLEDMDTTREVTKDTSESIKDTSEALEEFNDILTNDKSNVYDNVGNITDSFNDFTKSANNADYAIEKVIDSLDDFIFQFSDTLFNSIENNISKLNQIGQDTAFTSISYSEALNKAISARNDLVNNPLDVGIGEVYTNAYNQFVTSASDYLSDPTSFESSQDYAFARSTVGLQAEQFRGTADTTVDVLESMNNFLSTINQAFEDGILSDEEKATIAGVAGEVNDKLVGSNSVKTVLDSFMGANNEGISINGLVSGVNALSVATGLDVSELSNLASIKEATEYTTDGNTTSLKNLQVSSVIETETPKMVYIGNGQWGEQITTTTEYNYLAKGGFTGNGMGKKDSTGFKQAGIVHEGEYVAPKWMVDSQPAIFRELENARLNKGFANGGYTTPTVYNNNIQENNSDMQLQLLTRVTNIETILNRVSEGGDTIGVRLVG